MPPKDRHAPSPCSGRPLQWLLASTTFIVRLKLSVGQVDIEQYGQYALTETSSADISLGVIASSSCDRAAGPERSTALCPVHGRHSSRLWASAAPSNPAETAISRRQGAFRVILPLLGGVCQVAGVSPPPIQTHPPVPRGTSLPGWGARWQSGSRGCLVALAAVTRGPSGCPHFQAQDTAESTLHRQPARVLP